MLHWIQSGQQCSRQLWTQTKTLLYKQQLKCAQTGAQVGRPYQRLQIGLSVLLFFLLSSAILVAWPLLAAIELNSFDICAMDIYWSDSVGFLSNAKLSF